MEDDGDFDGGGDTPEPEDTSSRADVEEAVISQKQDRGDPDPRGCYGPQGRKSPRCKHERRRALSDSQKCRKVTLGRQERERDLSLEVSGA